MMALSRLHRFTDWLNLQFANVLNAYCHSVIESVWLQERSLWSRNIHLPFQRVLPLQGKRPPEQIISFHVHDYTFRGSNSANFSFFFLLNTCQLSKGKFYSSRSKSWRTLRTPPGVLGYINQRSKQEVTIFAPLSGNGGKTWRYTQAA